MKNPRISILAMITLLAVFFTLGLFIGRNYSGKPMTVSVPEEFRSPLPSPSPISTDSYPENQDSAFPIDINHASIFELTALPGIGNGLAEQIVAYREANGQFRHAEELLSVPGIGENRLEAILSLITVGGTQ